MNPFYIEPGSLFCIRNNYLLLTPELNPDSRVSVFLVLFLINDKQKFVEYYSPLHFSFLFAHTVLYSSTPANCYSNSGLWSVLDSHLVIIY